MTTHLGVIDRIALFGREAPLEVDLGCGTGAFLRQRAFAHPDVDFVGLEVRKPLVENLMKRRESEGPRNLAVFHASTDTNLALAAPGEVRCFHVHFPDPCFKRRHWKRRILQPKTVLRMADLLPLGGRVFLQSDVLPLAQEMYDFMAAEPAFESLLDPSMVVPSPFDERTDWERHHELVGEPVYRMLFAKRGPSSGRVSNLEFRETNPARVGSGGEAVTEPH
ncbi:MAG: tRNA (guanosine(46)-N7)-methyltransferase TrmB [Deltaproteobacteria bacterium]|nr:tRNA (guanosine(46)-N7)-methyltransferase TrmB [Deltaproteobacteria bacterium]